ncbi:MAG: MFS transporter [Candidatus Eremiobacteraeota bacterium]|nr:MFS transporter [Candidatus Eremiobacteraeota bacterium]
MRKPVGLAGHDLDRSTLPLLLTLGLGVFAGALDLGVLSPALPAIGQTFGVPTGSLAWIFTLYLLVSVVSIAITSTLADRYGRRPVYVGCVLTFALGSVIAVFSHSYGVFLLARAVQAFGAGGIFPVATAAIGDVVPAQRRGAALGLVAATWGLAAIIGPTFGGIVTHFISWRWIFIANFPLAIVVTYLATKHVPVNAPRVRGPLDVVGVGLLSLGLLALAYGLSAPSLPSIGFSLTVFALFYFWERNSRSPVIAPVLLTNSQLRKTYALELVIGMLEGALFFIPTVLVGAQHLSYLAAGLIAAIGALVFVAVIPISGRMLDRIGSRDVLLIGALATEIGLVIFALGFSSLWLAVLAMVVAGIGFGALLGAPTRFIITNQTTQATRATAVGLLSQFLIMGQIIGASIAGGVIGQAANDLRGFKSAYEIFAALAFLAIIIAATLKSRRAERIMGLEAGTP